MTEQLDRWRGAFGDEYAERNQMYPAARITAWRIMLEGLSLHSILEVGAGLGANLHAIRALSLSRRPQPRLAGLEPNAKTAALGNVTCGTLDDLKETGTYDLVFTCGVLIHVPPEELNKTLRQIYRLSRRYILAIEYYAEQETMIPYRGLDNMLWKRDYERHYLKVTNVRTIRSGFWSKAEGFDDCHWWLMEQASPSLFGVG